MERIHESAAETAKKVRKTLKQEFPGVKFTVRSSTYSMGSSVSVRWTDGPMRGQVDTVLSRFESSSFDGMTDCKTLTGYSFEGKMYCGADYVTGSRDISPEYAKQIEDHAKEIFEDFDHNDYHSFRQLEEAEKDLLGIAEDSFESFEDEEVTVPEVIAFEEPTVPEASNIINFADRAAAKRVKTFSDSLTPEQNFKMVLLTKLMGEDAFTDLLITTNFDVDKLFTLSALAYEKKPLTK